jgi:hypothetical protein
MSCNQFGLLRAVASCIAFLMISTAAFAQTFIGPLPYVKTADSPFFASITGGTTLLETFESGALATPGVTASTGAVVAPSSITDSVDADDGVIDGSGTGGHSFFSVNGAAGITFTFDATVLGGLPTQVGIVWTDGAGTTLFEAFGPGGVPLGQIGPVAIADGNITGETAEDRFFGVTNPAGISSIRISNTSGGIEVDHLQYGPIAAAPALPTLSINNFSANEGNSGTTSFVFTVTLSAASASTVTASFATSDGTATAGSDYVANSGVVTFTPGQTTQTITVNVNGDTAVEANETFFVTLSAPTNATLAVAQGTGTIVNDDSAIVGPAANVPVPTLGEWSLALLALTLALLAIGAARRRR